MVNYTLKVVQTGTKLRISGTVTTVIDGFELVSVQQGKVEGKVVHILATVQQRSRVNIFSTGQIDLDHTFDVPENMAQVHILVNGQFEAYLDITQAS